MSITPTLDQFRGCLLGQAVADGFGAPFEGLSSEIIFHEFGRVSELVKHPPVDILYYTDDTQMAIGIAETLIECGNIDEEYLVRAFAENYDEKRGYGQGARKILEAMGQGGDWRSLAQNIFPGGSYGNGAAMRVAPIGLYYYDDLDRVAAEAKNSAIVTHTHELGIEGAQLLAVAVAIALTMDPFDRAQFYQVLQSYAKTEEFQWCLSLAAQLTPDDTLITLGNSLEAHRSVVTSIACFANAPDSYVRAISHAVSMGDDTDTLAAMAGAIAGARLGIRSVPEHLLALLENDHKGRSYVELLAANLYGKVASA